MRRHRALVKSITHAYHGLTSAFHSERNFQIQFLCALLAVSAAWYWPLLKYERIVIVLIAVSVLVLELMNSVLERLADASSARLSPIIKEIKDMMAGAVLLTALAAVGLGIYIFSPHFSVTLCDIIDLC